jgi:hypothetical protein
MVGDSGDTAMRSASRDRYVRAIKIATTAITAAILMTGLSACNDASMAPGDPIEGELEYQGTIHHQVIVIDNGKKVDCAVAAANGVSLTCDWAGAH